MKNLIILLLISFLFSCQHELNPKEKYKEETYQLLNDAMIPFLINTKQFSKEYFNVFKIFESPENDFIIDQPTRYKSVYKKISKQVFQ